MDINEDQIGTDGTELQFPNISSCMSITVLLGNGQMIGTHLTVGSTKAQVDAALAEMRKLAAGQPITQVVMAGREYTWSAWNSDPSVTQGKGPASGKDYTGSQFKRTVAKALGVKPSQVETHNTVPKDKGFAWNDTGYYWGNVDPGDKEARIVTVTKEGGRLKVDIGVDPKENSEFEATEEPANATRIKLGRDGQLEPEVLESVKKYRRRSPEASTSRGLDHATNGATDGATDDATDGATDASSTPQTSTTPADEKATADTAASGAKEKKDSGKDSRPGWTKLYSKQWGSAKSDGDDNKNKSGGDGGDSDSEQRLGWTKLYSKEFGKSKKDASKIDSQSSSQNASSSSSESSDSSNISSAGSSSQTQSGGGGNASATHTANRNSHFVATLLGSAYGAGTGSRTNKQSNASKSSSANSSSSSNKSQSRIRIKTKR